MAAESKSSPGFSGMHFLAAVLVALTAYLIFWPHAVDPNARWTDETMGKAHMELMQYPNAVLSTPKPSLAEVDSPTGLSEADQAMFQKAMEWYGKNYPSVLEGSMIGAQGSFGDEAFLLWRMYHGRSTESTWPIVRKHVQEFANRFAASWKAFGANVNAIVDPNAAAAMMYAMHELGLTAEGMDPVPWAREFMLDEPTMYEDGRMAWVSSLLYRSGVMKRDLYGLGMADSRINQELSSKKLKAAMARPILKDSKEEPVWIMRYQSVVRDLIALIWVGVDSPNDISFLGTEEINYLKDVIRAALKATSKIPKEYSADLIATTVVCAHGLGLEEESDKKLIKIVLDDLRGRQNEDGSFGGIPAPAQETEKEKESREKDPGFQEYNRNIKRRDTLSILWSLVSLPVEAPVPPPLSPEVAKAKAEMEAQAGPE